MNYKIVGNSIFGTRRVTPDGRAYDNEFRSISPVAYTKYSNDQGVGALICAMMEHYSAESECAIETDFGKIIVYQTPVHHGLIVCRCIYNDGAYVYSPVFINTVSPLAIVNYFQAIYKCYMCQ